MYMQNSRKTNLSCAVYYPRDAMNHLKLVVRMHKPAIT